MMKISRILLLLTGAALLTGAPLAGSAGAQTPPADAHFDVTSPAFGAAGDGAKDDTAAIQAAFNACWKQGEPGQGGIVRFPGPHTYIVSATINAYDGCQIEGSVGIKGGGYAPAEIKWNGPAAGTVYQFSGFTTSANGSPYLSSPAFPLLAGSTVQNRVAPYVTTFTGANSLSAGQWVDIEGLSTAAGLALNRGIFQVASATPTEFTVEMTFKPPVLGPVSDAGTATTVNVTITFDANGHFEESISNIAFGTRDPNNPPDVGIY
ncbi:MAG: glycosyl hydrolase family 28-related protein, partial [Terracidiphilus sp.]